MTVMKTKSKVNKANTKSGASSKKSTKQTIQVKQEKDKTKERQLAEIMLAPTSLNTYTAINYIKGSIDGDLDLCEAIQVMKEKVQLVNNGDTKALEATLATQVSVLDAIFNSLAIKSKSSDTMSKMESYMRLALKAQSQCSRTIEVLANMKNPPLVVAKQANIANGHQQVNNTNSVSGNDRQTYSHAGKTKKQTNELLEGDDGSKTMDISATQSTSRKDKAMATLETQHRR